MGLLTVVIGVVYGSMFAMVQASRASDRQARFTNEVASPLLVIDKVLVQNSAIEQASPYRLVVLTDRDLEQQDGAHHHRGDAPTGRCTTGWRSSMPSALPSSV
jgi:hypothetical protein